MQASEDRLIAWLRRRLGDGGAALGDDTAFLAGGGDLALSVDQQIEGVHFPAGLQPAAVGRRLVRVAVSDLAAVGARPAFALLALAAPPGLDPRPLLAAAAEESQRFGLDLVGGDIARSERLATSLTVGGRRPPRGRWVRRDTARPGDRLWLGGTVGESAIGCQLLAAGARLAGRAVELPPALGLSGALAATARRAVRRHLLPEPQLALGRWLGRRRRAAAIDLSDGLALDLDRLCRASGVGAVLEAAHLPLADGHRRLCAALGLEPERLALSGGEDYVLLFALPPEVEPRAVNGAVAVGHLRAAPGLDLDRDGHLTRLAPDGWDHLHDGP